MSNLILTDEDEFDNIVVWTDDSEMIDGGYNCVVGDFKNGFRVDETTHHVYGKWTIKSIQNVLRTHLPTTFKSQNTNLKTTD